MDFTAFFKTPETEGKEKHLPFIERGSGHSGTHDNVIIVTVGKETPHPNTIEHHIEYIELFGIKKANDQVIFLGRQEFSPTYTDPVAKFKIINLTDFKAVSALSYCNLHGVWKNTIDL